MPVIVKAPRIRTDFMTRVVDLESQNVDT